MRKSVASLQLLREPVPPGERFRHAIEANLDARATVLPWYSRNSASRPGIRLATCRGQRSSLESRVEGDLASGRLRVVLEPHTPEVPGLYLYFPKRSQVSPALKAFVEIAREKAKADRVVT